MATEKRRNTSCSRMKNGRLNRSGTSEKALLQARRVATDTAAKAVDVAEAEVEDVVATSVVKAVALLAKTAPPARTRAQ